MLKRPFQCPSVATSARVRRVHIERGCSLRRKRRVLGTLPAQAPFNVLSLLITVSLLNVFERFSAIKTAFEHEHIKECKRGTCENSHRARFQNQKLRKRMCRRLQRLIRHLAT
ncbi:hypothetical protein L596_003360 [Steinernema carpocapsae]|uniref:Uncharacterized protein n=1 Tax=Steinernema carpocapsae TaxID=34508 RepID=A0A4U8UWA6_STECR|nr:hypothetical protein L596_003360 [Steinernema carpocapsae]